MKKTKILLTIILLFIVIGATYASWQAGGGVKWISKTEVEQKADRFIDHSSDTGTYGTGYYLDTYTGLKWAAKDSGITMKWSTSTSYTEPTWNGTNYIRTYATTEDGGHTIGSNIIGTDTDYPPFAYCVGLGNGWRLPTKRENFSIMTDKKPDGMSFYTALPSVSNNGHWSSTVTAYNTSIVRVGSIIYGTTYINTKTNSVRQGLCVHD